MKNKRKIFEAPIDEPTGFSINPDLKRAIERGETPLSNSPFIPKKGEDDRQSFEEIAASKRFRDVVTKLERYLQIEIPKNLMGVQKAMMEVLVEINRFESTRKQELEQLAKDLVSKELVDPKYAEFIKFDAKLVGMGEVGSENFQAEPEEFSSEDIELAFEDSGEDLEEFVDAFENFDYMVAKRRFMNAIIQGAAKKGHFMFELIRDTLEEMEPGITTKYGTIMALNDYLYWLLPPQMTQQMAAAGQGMGGSEEIEMEQDEDGEYTGNFVVKARAIMFPILVHELIKGYYDILGAASLPTDPIQAQMVKQTADTLVNEIFDIISGTYLWEKLLETYPAKVLEDNMKIVQSLIFREFSKLPKNKFTSLAQRVNKGDATAYTEMESIADQIIDELNKQDLEEILGNSNYDGDDDDDTMGYPSDDDDDDDIDLSFLSDLGIDTPPTK
jgi:hypothetical protein